MIRGYSLWQELPRLRTEGYLPAALLPSIRLRNLLLDPATRGVVVAGAVEAGGRMGGVGRGA